MKSAYCFAALACLALGVCLGSPNLGVCTWGGLATVHFAIFTTNRNNSGKDVIELLETARLFFEHTGWAARDLKKPINILAFDSDKQFDSYRINPGAFAFYQPTREGDFVVMRSLEPEHYSVVVHEYTHYVVGHAGLTLPLWLNEGLADFYSTLQCRQAQVVLGTPPPGRGNALQRGEWMDWSTLAAVDQRSPYYRQSDKMLLFYAQSWAMVRMLALNPAYANDLPKFLTAVSSGASTQDALSATYHKTLAELGQEVEQNMRSKLLEPRALNVDVRPGPLQTSDVADAQKEAEFALADVLAANPRTLEEGKGQLEALGAKYPDDPRSQESLGFMAMRAGAKSVAEHHFTLAISAHSKDPDALFALAHLKIGEGGEGAEVLDLLQKAVAIDPTHYNARLELGFVAAKNKRFDLAAEALEGIAKPKPEHAYSVSYMLAYCFSELHRAGDARIYAEQARKIAANKSDQEQVAGLVTYLEQESPAAVGSR
jgi:tetratricopeptide (TPR) repeat protein